MFKKLKSLFSSDSANSQPVEEQQQDPQSVEAKSIEAQSAELQADTPDVSEAAEYRQPEAGVSETATEVTVAPVAEAAASEQSSAEVAEQLVEAPAEDMSADQALADNAQVEDVVAADAPVEEAVIEQAVVEETVANESPAEELPAETDVAEAVAEQNAAASEPEVIAAPVPAPAITDVEQPQPKPEKKGLFARIKSGLSRTKANLSEGLGNIFLGAKEIDDDLLEEIETQLLMADVGVEATTEIIKRLTDRVSRKQLADADALYQALKDELAALLAGAEQPLVIENNNGPYVILMVGVNGVGKTTTIGKLTKRLQSEGKSVMLAAGDTFRAAAVEQLQVWGERNNVPVVAQHTGADSASVLYDALQSAQAKDVDVVIADTAGRLQNKDNLMQELEKVVRVMKKLDVTAPHEVMLVLDAGTGQNAMNQASQFKDVVGVSGITLTKLDGTAKGGIIFAIAKQLELPIRFIGVGEQVDDLRPFRADEFVKALFD